VRFLLSRAAEDGYERRIGLDREAVPQVRLDIAQLKRVDTQVNISQ
jgi:hypothetical protein